LRQTTAAQTARIKPNFPSGIAQPALRALSGAGLESLEQLTGVSETELLKLHGMGPAAVKKLRAALLHKGLTFRSDQATAARSQ
jgi:DNA repair protein RadC